jgi:hypothetical protein
VTSPKHHEVPRWVLGYHHGPGATCSEQIHYLGELGTPTSLGASVFQVSVPAYPSPFLTRDHHEEEQTGRYRDRLETQQETGWGFRGGDIINLLTNNSGPAGREGASPLPFQGRKGNCL